MAGGVHARNWFGLTEVRTYLFVDVDVELIHHALSLYKVGRGARPFDPLLKKELSKASP